MTVVADGSVLGRLALSCRGSVGLGRVSAEEDVGDVAVVAAVDGGVAGHLGAVRHMVRRGTFQYGSRQTVPQTRLFTYAPPWLKFSSDAGDAKML